MICSKCNSHSPDNASFCLKCGEKLNSNSINTHKNKTSSLTTSVETIKIEGGKKYVLGKNCYLATILSLLLPGLGQFYNGDYIKGVIYIFIIPIFFPVALFLSGGLLSLAINIISAFDAYRVATGNWPLWK